VQNAATQMKNDLFKKEGIMDWDHDYADYLDENGIKKIQELEKETGTLIMAFPTPPMPATLDETAKKKIEALEKQLCVRLVAYEKH
jgi:hypothetical protein